MNATVEVATASIEMTANEILSFALVDPPVLDNGSVSQVLVTSTVVSIGGTSISAVAPDHINYDWRLAEAA